MGDAQLIVQPQPPIAERKCCPGCGAVEYGELIRQAYASAPLQSLFAQHYEGRADATQLAGYDYWLVRCTQCGLAYQKNVPASALLNEIYEQWIPTSERDRLRREYTLDDFRYWAEQVQFVVQHLRKRPYEVRVFDFGMGWGEWALMAKAYGCEVAGAELSEVRIRHAQSMNIEVVPWSDIPRRRFDFINTEQVFEHLIDPMEVLKHLAGALEVGGVLKISVPDSRLALRAVARRGDFASLSSAEIMPIHPLEHINCFEHDTLVEMARRAGLRLLKPRLRHVYNGCSGWLNPKRALRQLARPLYRHVFPRNTFAYFVRG